MSKLIPISQGYRAQKTPRRSLLERQGHHCYPKLLSHWIRKVTAWNKRSPIFGRATMLPLKFLAAISLKRVFESFPVDVNSDLRRQASLRFLRERSGQDLGQ